jgi:hypothetical protein
MRTDPFAKKNSKPLLDAAADTRPSLENAVKGSSPRVIVSRRKLAELGEERATAVQVRIQINKGGKPVKRNAPTPLQLSSPNVRGDCKPFISPDEDRSN